MSSEGFTKEIELANYIRVIIQSVEISVKDGSPFLSKPAFGFHNRLVKWSEDFVVKGDYDDELKDAINNLNAKITTFETNRTGSKSECVKLKIGIRNIKIMPSLRSLESYSDFLRYQLK